MKLLVQLDSTLYLNLKNEINQEDDLCLFHVQTK